MSPELETLDQLTGGDLSLKAIRQLFPSDEEFSRGVLGLLSCGDVTLRSAKGVEVPNWQWGNLVPGKKSERSENLRLRITPQGAHRIE